ncbi:hypothetical protein BS78_04G257500 [Paspalum vaginatum]|nr:hypothetical protein BS78_04G257500 [Paspalum vaginatum]
MKSKGWRLAQAFQWVKDRRSQVQLTDASQHDLQEYEQKLFGPSAQPFVPTESSASLGLGYQIPEGDIQEPVFEKMTMPSAFERVSLNDSPTKITLGAESTTGVNPGDNNNSGGVNPASTGNLMDSS